MFIWYCASRVTDEDGFTGQVVGVAGSRARRGDGAGARTGQQRQEHAAQRAAGARTARRAHHAHRRAAATAVHQWRCDVQRVGRVGRAAAPRAVGAPLSTRARSHLRRRRRRSLATRSGARGVGAAAGASRHVRPTRAAARVRQQVGRAARACAHAGRCRAVPGAHHGQAVAHLCVVRAVGRRPARRRGVARAPAARRARARAPRVAPALTTTHWEDGPCVTQFGNKEMCYKK